MSVPIYSDGNSTSAESLDSMKHDAIVGQG